MLSTRESKLSTEQEQVWRMEQRYWQLVAARDRDGYIALWDENIVGWPDSSADPIRKDTIRSNPFAVFDGLKNEQLDLKALQVFNDVAVIYYLVRATYAPTGGSDVEVSFRMTHTWRKSDGLWHIIGGMSSPNPHPQ